MPDIPAACVPPISLPDLLPDTKATADHPKKYRIVLTTSPAISPKPLTLGKQAHVESMQHTRNELTVIFSASDFSVKVLPSNPVSWDMEGSDNPSTALSFVCGQAIGKKLSIFPQGDNDMNYNDVHKPAVD